MLIIKILIQDARVDLHLVNPSLLQDLLQVLASGRDVHFQRSGTLKIGFWSEIRNEQHVTDSKGAKSILLFSIQIMAYYIRFILLILVDRFISEINLEFNLILFLRMPN